MHRDQGPFAMSNKIKILLTKKELAIAGGASADKIKLHSPHRLKQYVKLARKLRDKYRDLTQRHKAAMKESGRSSTSFRTIAKAQAFDGMLLAFEKQSKKVDLKSKAKPALSDRPSKKNQQELDHEQHYDLDGVTRVDDKVVIPSNQKLKKEGHGPLAEPYSEGD